VRVAKLARPGRPVESEHRAQGSASGGDDDDDDVSDDDGDLVFGVGEDDPAFAVGEVTGSAGGGLGMAAESVLASIPPHRLRALEQLQADASEFNRATRVRRPWRARALCRPGPPSVLRSSLRVARMCEQRPAPA